MLEHLEDQPRRDRASGVRKHGNLVQPTVVQGAQIARSQPTNHEVLKRYPSLA